MANLRKIDDIIHYETKNLFIHLKDSEEYFKIRILNLTKKEIKNLFKNRKDTWFFILKDENIRNVNEPCLCLSYNSFKINITVSLMTDYNNKKAEYFYNMKYDDKEYTKIDYDRILEILIAILQEKEEL